MVVPYLRSLPNAIFQQDNARLHVARRVLTVFDALLFDCFPGLHGLHICQSLKIYGHGLLRDWPTIPLQLITVVEVWHRFEALWNELSVSVNQVQFDFMHTRVRVVLAVRDSSCFF